MLEPVLVFFDTAEQALRAALWFQALVEEHNQDRPPEEHLPLDNVAVHEGSVLLVPGSDIHWGDPVNTASKLSEDVIAPMVQGPRITGVDDKRRASTNSIGPVSNTPSRSSFSVAPPSPHQPRLSLPSITQHVQGNGRHSPSPTGSASSQRRPSGGQPGQGSPSTSRGAPPSPAPTVLPPVRRGSHVLLEADESESDDLSREILSIASPKPTPGPSSHVGELHSPTVLAVKPRRKTPAKIPQVHVQDSEEEASTQLNMSLGSIAYGGLKPGPAPSPASHQHGSERVSKICNLL